MFSWAIAVLPQRPHEVAALTASTNRKRNFYKPVPGLRACLFCFHAIPFDIDPYTVKVKTKLIMDLFENF